MAFEVVRFGKAEIVSQLKLPTKMPKWSPQAKHAKQKFPSDSFPANILRDSSQAKDAKLQIPSEVPNRQFPNDEFRTKAFKCERSQAKLTSRVSQVKTERPQTKVSKRMMLSERSHMKHSKRKSSNEMSKRKFLSDRSSGSLQSMGWVKFSK